MGMTCVNVNNTVLSHGTEIFLSMLFFKKSFYFKCQFSSPAGFCCWCFHQLIHFTTIFYSECIKINTPRSFYIYTTAGHYLMPRLWHLCEQFIPPCTTLQLPVARIYHEGTANNYEIHKKLQMFYEIFSLFLKIDFLKISRFHS